MKKLFKTGVLGVALAVAHGSALAALGAAPSTLDRQQDSQVLDKGEYSVHETRLDTETLVREYVSPDKAVFAVTWKGPSIPNLRQLLGQQYFENYTEAARNTPRRAPVRIDRPELVIQSGGHVGAFSGRAYLPGAIPQNLSIDTIQ